MSLPPLHLRPLDPWRSAPAREKLARWKPIAPPSPFAPWTIHVAAAVYPTRIKMTFDFANPVTPQK
jgi:hypothetical protein